MLLAKPVFVPVVAACHDIGYQMQCTSAIAYRHRKEAVSSALDPVFAHFKSQQMNKRATATTELSTLVDQIEESLLQCCQEVQQRANLPDAATMEVIKQYVKSQLDEEGSDQVIVLDITKSLDQRHLREIASRHSVSITSSNGCNVTIQGSHTTCLLAKAEIERTFDLPETQLKSIRSKIRSMKYERETIQMRMSSMKRCMIEVQCLGKLVKLVQHIIAESVFKSVLVHCNRALQAAEGDNPDNVILLHIKLLYEDPEVAFLPNSESIKHLFEELLHDVADTIQRVKLPPNSKLLQYVNLSKAPLLQSQNDARFQSLLSEFTNLVSDSFVLVEKFVGRFSSVNSLYRYLTSEWREIKMQWEHPQDVTPQCFRNTFANLDRVRKELISLYNKNIGPLHVNLLLVKDEILPIVKQCETDLEKAIILGWRTRVEMLLKDINETKRTVSDTSMKLSAFSALAKAIREVDSTMHTFVTREQESEALFDIIEKAGFQLTIESRGLRDSLIGVPTALETLQQALVLAKQHRDDKVKKASLELEEQTSILRKEIMKIKTILNESTLTSRNSQPEGALQQLADLDKLLQVKERSETELNICNENLGYDTLSLSADTRTLLDDLRTAWGHLSAWKKERTRIYRLPLRNVSGDHLEQQLLAFSAKARTSHSTLNIDLTKYLLEIAEEDKNTIPVIKCIVNPAMKSIHWKPIFEAIQQPYSSNVVYTIDKLLQWNIVAHSDLVQTQSYLASGQSTIEQAISELETSWDSRQFKLGEVNSVIRILNVDEVLLLLENSRAEVIELLSSKFIFNLQPALKSCLNTFDTAGRTLSVLSDVQKTWWDLQLASKATSSARELCVVDSSYKELMNRNTIGNGSILRILTDPRVTSLVRSSAEALNVSKESLLKQSLAKKREAPRLQGLSKEEFLLFLSGKPDFSLIFPGVAEMMRSESAYIGVVSANGEQLQFPNPVPDNPDPVSLLLSIQQALSNGMKASVSKAVRSRGPRRHDWVLNHCSQATQVADLVSWTSLCEQGILQNELKSARSHHADALATTMRTAQRAQLTLARSTAVFSLIVLNLNWNDILSRLLEEKGLTTSSFLWTKQLRMYPQPSNSGAVEYYVSHTSFNTNYGYEYQGCRPRCVQTPETDKASMLFALGLQSRSCISLEGPTLSGKSECVRDYAAALGKHIMTLECSPSTTTVAVSTLLYSAMSSGSWIMFDNFNMLRPEVLSVASHLLCAASAAAHSGAEVFTQVAQVQTEIPIKEFGVFTVLSNPSKYHSEIPQTLKSCVRPISICSPDPVHVATIILQGYGVENALFLGPKLGVFWKVALESLSPASRHNFTLKTLIHVATKLSASRSCTLPATLQMEELIKKLCLSSIGIDDSSTLNTLLRCCFDHTETIISSIDPKSIEECNYVAHSAFLNQVTAALCALEDKRTILLSGGACTGKSSCLECVSVIANCTLKALSPVMYTANELFGTNQQEGILSLLLKKDVSSKSTSNRKVIVFDCDVGDWVTAMLDIIGGSNVLRSTSGGSYRISTSTGIAIKCRSLEKATPSLLGRVHLITFDSGDLTAAHVLQRANMFGNPTVWNTNTINLVITWLADHSVTPSQARAFVTLLHALIKSQSEILCTVDAQNAFNMLVIHSATWGITSLNNRESWGDSLKDLFRMILPKATVPEDMFLVEPCIVTEVWNPWVYGKIDAVHKDVHYIVRDAEHLSRLKLSSMLVDNGVSVVLAGGHGCGKGLVLKHLSRKVSAKFTQLSPCNSSPTEIRGYILTRCEKMFVCVEDINVSPTHSEPTTAMDCFRHFINEKVTYTVTKQGVKEFKSTLVVAATSQTCHNLNKTPLGNCSIAISFPEVDDSKIQYLVDNHLQNVFSHSIVSARLEPVIPSLVKISCELWDAVGTCLKWQAKSPQYCLSVLDLMYCASSLSIWMPKITRVEDVVNLYKYELERTIIDRCNEDDRSWVIATIDEVFNKHTDKSSTEICYSKDGLCDIFTLQLRIEETLKDKSIITSPNGIQTILSLGRLFRIRGTSILLQGPAGSGRKTFIAAAATCEEARVIEVSTESLDDSIKSIRNALESASFDDTLTILQVDMSRVAVSKFSLDLVNYLSAVLTLCKGYLACSLVPSDFLMELAKIHSAQRSEFGVLEVLKNGCVGNLRVVFLASDDSIEFVWEYFSMLLKGMQHYVIVPNSESDLTQIASRSLDSLCTSVASLSVSLYNAARSQEDDTTSDLLDVEVPIDQPQPEINGRGTPLDVDDIHISKLFNFIHLWNKTGAEHIVSKRDKIESAIKLVEEVIKEKNENEIALQLALPELESLIEQNDNLSRCLERDNQAFVESKLQLAAHEGKLVKLSSEESTLQETIQSTLSKIMPMLQTAFEAIRSITKKGV
eukprot:TRINITY_DN16649_c0_g1_i2.p1 TRINITY_DN16649_c0_g1~~TRINITY_DN16649_c0_g1_i2.p1  ORF type:complete len:2380 (+),score=371.43 TRINITY_DN16649_c0_g1_i2:981-8120(+)